jgi:hypothetical protein
MYACMFLYMYVCMYVMHVCVCVCARIGMYYIVHGTFTKHLNNLPVNLHQTFFWHLKDISDHKSQVVRFSTFVFIFNDYTELGEGIYNATVHNTYVPLDIQKTTDIHRKCTHHLCHHYSCLVLTFWTHLIYTVAVKSPNLILSMQCSYP